MIVHTGEALIDFIPTRDEEGRLAYTPVPGGSPYNSAVATARLGVPNVFLGKIATDFFGDQLVSHLQKNGVGSDWIVRDERLSTLAFVQRSETGDARYAFFAENAADRALAAADVPPFSDEVQAIQFGSISLIPDPVGATILELVQRERPRRVTSFDPNIRESLITDAAAYRDRITAAIAASTVVKISDEDLGWIYPDRTVDEAVTEILGGGTRLVVVTRGAEGAFASTAAANATVAAHRVTVADTVGAGDSFHGGILAWLYHEQLLTERTITGLTNDQLTAMLVFAGTVSATTCSRPGNDPPTLAELASTVKSWE